MEVAATSTLLELARSRYLEMYYLLKHSASGDPSAITLTVVIATIASVSVLDAHLPIYSRDITSYDTSNYIHYATLV